MYLKWNVPESFINSPEVEYRNSLFRHLEQQPLALVARHCTNMTVERFYAFVDLALQQSGVTLRGVGLEAGAGSGFLSAVCAAGPEVSRIYAVEACEESARLLIPKVASSLLGKDAAKVTPVFGSFDDIGLPDASLDFILELHSYHHSHNLKATLAEAARVLKPGGFLLGFDRLHPNTLTDEEVEKLLEATYSKEFLRANFYPEDLRLTRRENGEHEYRMFEWEAAFREAGLHRETMLRFEKAVGFKTAIAGCVNTLVPGGLPGRWSRRTWKDTASWLRQNLTSGVIAAPRSTTLFVLKKAPVAVATGGNGQNSLVGAPGLEPGTLSLEG